MIKHPVIPLAFFASLIAFVLVTSQANADDSIYSAPAKLPDAPYSEFMIPKMSKPPVIDGKIDEQEWATSFHYAASLDQNPGPWRLLYARPLDWWMGWDDDHLYIAMRSDRVAGENPLAAYREPRLGGNTVMDDSIEVNLNPVGRNARNGKLPWAAQTILNSLGVGYYSSFAWTVAARSTTWHPDWKIATAMHEDNWTMEISIPRQSLDLDAPLKAGEPWSVLLARDWKRFGWDQTAIPAKLGGFGFGQPTEYPFAWLSDGPYAQLDGLLPMIQGKPATHLRLGTTGDKPVAMTIKLSMKPVTGGGDTFEENKTITVQPGAPMDWNWNPEKPLDKIDYLYDLTVTAEGSPHPVLDSQFFVHPGSDAALREGIKKLAETKGNDYNFTAAYAPSTSQLSVQADFLYSKSPEPPVALDVEIKDGEGKSRYNGETTRQFEKAFTDTLVLPKLETGSYSWQLSLVDKDKKAIATQDGKFEKKNEAETFPWWNFAGGEIDKVLWPYKALQVHEGGAKVDYWGGSFYLNGLGLPRQVMVTANQEWRPAQLEESHHVLARPIEVTAQVKGKSAPVSFLATPRLADDKGYSARMRGVGKIGSDIDITSKTSLGQDGLLWIELTLAPATQAPNGTDVTLPQADLDGLQIDVPFNPDIAELLVAHSAPGYGAFYLGALAQTEGKLWDSTQVGQSVLTVGNMLCTVWVGNDQRGMAFFAENNSGWVNAGKPDQEIIRTKDAVVLRLDIIQSPIIIKKPITLRFGFMPTPMKPMIPGWRMLNTSFNQVFADPYSTGRDVSASAPYNSSVNPANYSRSRDMIIRNSQASTSPSAGGTEFIPHTERSGYETYSHDHAAKDYFGPEWAQNTWTPEFQNHLLWNIQQWVEKGGLTGLYHDQFFPCSVTNTLTGAAFILDDGRINRGYNMLKDRQLQMREYALFLENGIQPRIFAHCTNGGQMIAFPWITATLDGEDNLITTGSTRDFSDNYPSARMRAFGNPWNWGDTFYWMRLIAGSNDKAWQTREDRAYRGWTLLHDDMFANGVETMYRQQIFDWGMNSNDVKFWPYWRNKQYVFCDQDDVRVSFWSLSDRLLVCVFNTNKEKTLPVNLRFPLAEFGLEPNLRTEFIQATSLTDLPVKFDPWSGGVSCTVAPHDFELFCIRKFSN